MIWLPAGKKDFDLNCLLVRIFLWKRSLNPFEKVFWAFRLWKGFKGKQLSNLGWEVNQRYLYGKSAVLHFLVDVFKDTPVIEILKRKKEKRKKPNGNFS